MRQKEKRGDIRHFCSIKCSKENQKEDKNRRTEEYNKNPKKCPNCGSVIPYKNRLWKVYCSSRCFGLYSQKDGGHCHWSEEGKRRISEWAKQHAYRTPRKRIKKNCKFCNTEFEVQPYKIKQLCCSRKCRSEWDKKPVLSKEKTEDSAPTVEPVKKDGIRDTSVVVHGNWLG